MPNMDAKTPWMGGLASTRNTTTNDADDGGSWMQSFSAMSGVSSCNPISESEVPGTSGWGPHLGWGPHFWMPETISHITIYNAKQMDAKQMDAKHGCQTWIRWPARGTSNVTNDAAWCSGCVFLLSITRPISESEVPGTSGWGPHLGWGPHFMDAKKWMPNDIYIYAKQMHATDMDAKHE